jgi:hypothetical protein
MACETEGANPPNKANNSASRPAQRRRDRAVEVKVRRGGIQGTTVLLK